MAGELKQYRNFVMDSRRWEGFAFRPGDVVISTPAKCGTTWMQMMTALVLFRQTTFERPLAELSPWLDMLTIDRDEVVASLEAQRHRRFIKSHTPLDGLPQDDRVTYVCVGRDPRDVALSWDDHLSNMDLGQLVKLRQSAVGLDDLTPDDIPPPPAEDPVDRFWQWVDAPPEAGGGAFCLASMLQHLRTYWEARHRPNVALFHYADLEADLEGEMRRLAARLEVDVPEDRWPDLVDAARFDRMKARAGELAPNAHQSLWHDTGSFFRRGGSGRWQGVLGEEDLARYDARVASFGLPPDFVAWVHGGTGTTT